ncbi:four-carbon acid sugar kinase family protein [Deinococcus sp. SM5_A1]|uniref:four-carbon acid sugar kinase family protein n=1 Tax=Deinococcus sp. SM5_A1 TaxID=3379094 RepID=UPI00385FD37D
MTPTPTNVISTQALSGDLPPPWADLTLNDQVRQARGNQRLVVLDDDPTGMQTLYGLPVVLRWEGDELRNALIGEWPAIYVLTNSRSLDAPAAAAVVRDVMNRVVILARELHLEVLVVSRSDSTLRGHYPLETDVVASALSGQQRLSGTVLAPAFIEGGRVTRDGMHYLVEGDQACPVSETEFARDPAFAYHTSYLPAWVAEKTAGRIQANEVSILTLNTIRQGGPDGVAAWFMALTPPFTVTVDALVQADLDVVALGAWKVRQAGISLQFRTAASMVRALAGLPARAVLATAHLRSAHSQAGGLCVVGSYIGRSSEQLAQLLALSGVQAVELNVGRVLDSETDAEIRNVSDELEYALAAGLSAVLYTTRGLRTGGTPEMSLQIGRAVSRALSAVVNNLKTEPSFLIAKGGITSHDLALDGLGVHTAQVLGQALPGVPVWALGPETRFPGLPYIVFPGNVGSPGSLADLFQMLSTHRDEALTGK